MQHLAELQRLRDRLKDIAIEEAQEHFYAFVQLIAPVILPEGFTDGAHIKIITTKLEEVERGRGGRVMLFMPPRSMKSRLGSILFTAWCLGRHPKWDIMSVSYSKELAIDFSREVRNLVQTEEYQEIFPGTELRKDSRAANRWHTTRGGVYTAGGIKSGIAGKGAHVAVIDDPLSEQDAFSEAK
ncbi:MAG: hypothetical protein MN733_32155, partial [Nitrososphaera sp.]|nr:hypothetical protein [Nitrososphaera sp.]